MYEETPWTFDANDVSDRPYTSERSGDAPSFESGAEVTVSNADEKSVVVSFPSAVSADETHNNDMISRYKVVLTDQETESSVTRYVFADYYKNPDRRRADWDVKITGLSEGTTYDVAVTAVTSFGQESEPITGEAQTTEDVYVTPTADVLDLDDIADVQGFYRAESGEEIWAEAEKADFNADGVIDLTDLVEISNAYLRQ